MSIYADEGGGRPADFNEPKPVLVHTQTAPNGIELSVVFVDDGNGPNGMYSICVSKGPLAQAEDFYGATQKYQPGIKVPEADMTKIFEIADKLDGKLRKDLVAAARPNGHGSHPAPGHH